ncbi:MAG: hypothetical protein ABSE54_07210 [Smithella sp.]|jgi:hypothetical protein
MLKVIVACDPLLFVNTIQHVYVVVGSQLVTALGIAFGLEVKSPLGRNVKVYVVPPPGRDLIAIPCPTYIPFGLNAV